MSFFQRVLLKTGGDVIPSLSALSLKSEPVEAPKRDADGNLLDDDGNVIFTNPSNPSGSTDPLPGSVGPTPVAKKPKAPPSPQKLYDDAVKERDQLKSDRNQYQDTDYQFWVKVKKEEIKKEEDAYIQEAGNRQPRVEGRDARKEEAFKPIAFRKATVNRIAKTSPAERNKQIEDLERRIEFELLPNKVAADEKAAAAKAAEKEEKEEKEAKAAEKAAAKAAEKEELAVAKAAKAAEREATAAAKAATAAAKAAEKEATAAAKAATAAS
jgi:hypothetical protein